jgi:hypothetical protein
MLHEQTPLFRHPRLMAAVMLVVLAVVTGSALYVRPLSGQTYEVAAEADKR